MRFLKVVAAFFLIGFLAGSLDAAASLGNLERSRLLHKRNVDASIVRSSAAGVVAFAPIDLARDLWEQAPSLPVEIMVVAIPGELPEELRRAAPLRSALFLPQEPEWWGDRHRNGPRRLVTFGPGRPISEPDPQPFSRKPAEPPFSVPTALSPGRGTARSTEAGGGKQVPAGDNAWRQEFIMPFERGRVTSLFNQGRYHPAIDLAGALGSAVHATTRRQRVTFTGWKRGYGYTVMTRDEKGRAHLYAHLQRIAVRIGNVLDQRQVLGRLGSTGRSTGPHVHYEVRTSAGRHVNPVTLLFPGRRVGRGFAWNGALSVTRLASNAQPLPR